MAQPSLCSAMPVFVGLPLEPEEAGYGLEGFWPDTKNCYQSTELKRPGQT